MVDASNMYKFFCGRWKFSRLLTSLATSSLIGRCDNGIASMVPWIPPVTENQTTQGAACSNSDRSGSLLWLLYREKGSLQYSDQSAPVIDFTRQYAYKFNGYILNYDSLQKHKFPEANNGTIEVYFCQANKPEETRKYIQNPADLCVPENAFKLDYLFHQLQFSSLKEVSSLEPLKQRDTGPETGTPVLSAECQHPCNKDMYDGVYEVQSGNQYTVKWCVKGPNKSYLSETNYEKITD